ncbi:hypothetical protein Tco_0835144 [Tanacetum coccineum]
MMASFFQMNTASSSGSGSLPGNTIANPKGELKAITTRIALVLDGPSIPMPPPFINPKEDERAEETLKTDPELAEHDNSSYSNKPLKESINIIYIYNVSHEDYLEDLFATNHPSGNPTPISDPIVSSSPTLTSLEESDLIWEEFEAYLTSDSFPPGSDDTNFDPEGYLCLIEELLNNPSSPLPLSHNPISCSTTSSSLDHLLEEFTDELALITFPPGNDDLPFDIEFRSKEMRICLTISYQKKWIHSQETVDEKSADPNKRSC